MDAPPLKLGLVCLARLTFEHELAGRWFADAQAALRALPSVELHAAPSLVIEAPDTEAAIAQLRAADIDALVIANGTFALGGLAMQLAQALDVPILLWAWREPAEKTDKLRLNSLVGANVNASNLYKLGFRPQTLYAAHDDPSAHDAIQRFARAARAKRALSRLRLGLIGGHAPGFDNLAANKALVRRALGVEVVDVGLESVVGRANAAVSAEPASSAFDDVRELNAGQIAKYDALVAALRGLARDAGFGAMALKCWGDLVNAYGIAGCGAVSLLSGTGLLVGCEGDVMGAISMTVAEALTGEPGFLTDLVTADDDTNTSVFWHVGCAPVCLAAGGQPRRLLSHFAGGKGVTAGFALKPGRVTVFRLGDDGRDLRMFATTGEALASSMDMRGTLTRVRWDAPAARVMGDILADGWEHHMVMAYGDVMPELRMLARMLKVPLAIPA